MCDDEQMLIELHTESTHEEVDGFCERWEVMACPIMIHRLGSIAEASRGQPARQGLVEKWHYKCCVYSTYIFQYFTADHTHAES